MPEIDSVERKIYKCFCKQKTSKQQIIINENVEREREREVA